MAAPDLDLLHSLIDQTVHTNGPSGKTTATGLNALLHRLTTDLPKAGSALSTDKQNFQSLLSDAEFTQAFHDSNSDAGTFMSTPYWRYLSGWQQSDGAAVATNANYLFQDFPAVVGSVYTLIVKVSAITAGTLYLANIGGYANASFQAAISQPGIYSYNFAATATTERLQLFGNNSFSGVVESVDVGTQSTIQIDQDLSSNSATSVPSVAAVSAALKDQPTFQQLANVMHRTGDESIDGGKTFTQALYQHQIAGMDMGFRLAGTEYYDQHTESASGVRIVLGVNRPGNRQLWIGADEAFGSNALGVFRYGTGTTLPRIDAVTGDGQVRLNVAIGSDTKNVSIGGSESNQPSEKLEVFGNAKAIAFIGDGSQLTNLPHDVTKADLVNGKISVSQLPTRDPYAIQDDARVVAAVTGGIYVNGELQSGSANYATATGSLVLAGDRIVSTNFVHEYCRLAGGSLGWVRWAKG